MCDFDEYVETTLMKLGEQLDALLDEDDRRAKLHASTVGHVRGVSSIREQAVYTEPGTDTPARTLEFPEAVAMPLDTASQRRKEGERVSLLASQ
jgi:hypothetical protein